MAEMKNICGKIPMDLHEKVREEIELTESSTQKFLQQVIEEHFNRVEGKGEVLNETGRSGYATYQKVAFDLARLAEFDPEGVAEHCRFAGIEVPKEKPQKTKKQNRGEERNQGNAR